MKKAITNISLLLLTLILAFGMIITACEGPAGSQGPQGTQGEQGPVGPAGQDGSVMYADEGTPGVNIGQNGDYYLNQNTGELYGPKDGDGWGNPIIVHMGEDGDDGEHGTDGQDGEDGSQIYSGSGARDGSLGVAGDFYLDEDNYELYGPKTGSGWGSPLNLKSADGNTNVTRYIFPAHDFSAHFDLIIYMGVNGLHQSAWKVYFKHTTSFNNDIYYHMPGWGLDGDSAYQVFHFNTIMRIRLQSGPGEAYYNIEIIRIEASNTVDNRKQKGPIIPEHLDVSNYEEVAEYFGFRN